MSEDKKQNDGERKPAAVPAKAVDKPANRMLTPSHSVLRRPGSYQTKG